MPATQDRSQKFVFCFPDTHETKEYGEMIVVVKKPKPPTPTLFGLQDNLNRLAGLHKRLKVMLADLQKLVDE